ncbi:MAG: hypothetical protein EOP87_03350 [Verrucomicrobiaceae bacterium]|nr:MAG: hypothetical protein EOP87_03350 [Verrucomicrobiaceae bacterium]
MAGIRRAGWILAFVAAGSGTSAAREFDFSKYSTKLRNFISDTVFGVEAGDREKQSKRLPGVVTLNVHGDAAAKALVEAKLGMFLTATGVRTEALAAGGGKHAQLEVHIGESGKLIPEAAAISKEISLDRGHTYWTWWDDERFVIGAVIFICTDRVAAGRMEDKLVENLFHVFGFPATSKDTDASCLSESDPNFPSLQPIDQAILKFYYKEVPAGTKPSALDKIVREKWPK